MSRLKFHHVFWLLLLLAGGSAFVVQPRFNRVKAPFLAIFWPVSKPSQWVGSTVRARFVHPEVPKVTGADGRALDETEIRHQNEELRGEISSLTAQLEELRQRNAEQELVGVVRPYCTPVSVSASDSGARQSLLLSTAGAGGLSAGAPVLYQQNIVGRVELAGLGAAQVRLTTDSGFRVSASFRRFKQDAQGRWQSQRLPAATQLPLVEGDGKGRMWIRNLDLREVKTIGLAANDWVVLDDPGQDWPLMLQGYQLGEVADIRPRHDEPLHALIEVRPRANWMQLKRVMVMNRK